MRSRCGSTEASSSRIKKMMSSMQLEKGNFHDIIKMKFTILLMIIMTADLCMSVQQLSLLVTLILTVDNHMVHVNFNRN